MNIIHFGQIDDNNLPTSIDVSDIDLESYISNNATSVKHTGMQKVSEISDDADKKALKHCVITADFEARHSAPVRLSKRVMKKKNRNERLATAGTEWFNMKPPELNDDIKRDYGILLMRSVVNPRRFYKSNDRKTMPKYFQVGKVMDNAADFYSSRIPKKERKQTLAEELLADAEFQKHRKKKMSALMHKRNALATKRTRTKKRKTKAASNS